MFTLSTKTRPPVLICISDTRACYWIVLTQLVGKLDINISWPKFYSFSLFQFINIRLTSLLYLLEFDMLPFSNIEARGTSFILVQTADDEMVFDKL